MKVLFDHQIFVNQTFGGISRYFYELYKRFATSYDNESEISSKFTNNVYLKEEGITGFFPNQVFKGKQRAYNYINQLNTVSKLRKRKYDIFHPTYFDNYFLKYIGDKPFVITFFDMIHERFAHKFVELANDKSVLENKYILAKSASRIIAISEATKRDMVEIMGIDPSKIDVVYLGSSFDASIASQKSFIEKPYLLFVGTRNIYKNFVFFLKSIQSLIGSGEIILVCAGGGAFTDSEIKLIADLNLKGKVIHEGINDFKLASLYRHAEAFVFPSLYEGFGIPVLEAFACKCPCIISNVSSLPEIGGNAAAYFDPSDSLSILSSVTNIINDVKEQDRLRLAGENRLKLFSWNNTFEESLAIYNNIV